MPGARVIGTVLLPFLFGGAQASDAPPRAVTASYDVYMNGIHVASMNETFEAHNGEYRLISESRAVGLVGLVQRQTVRYASSGRITRPGLQPMRFEGRRGEEDPRNVRGEFDWQARQLTLEHRGRTETLPLPRGTQDRLSVMYQFMFLAPRDGQRLRIDMTNGRKLDRYEYQVMPPVELETPLGRLKAVHLVRQRNPGDNATEIWLSPQHRHLPVRLMIEDNGTRYDQIITRLDITP